MHRDDQPFYIKSYVDKDSILYQDSPINSLKIFKAPFHANSILVLNVTPVSGHCQVMVFSHTHTHTLRVVEKMLSIWKLQGSMELGGSVTNTVDAEPGWSKALLCTWGWSSNSSLHIGHGCMESPCRRDLCFTLSHSSDDSGNGGGGKRPNFWATGKIRHNKNSRILA